MEGKDIAKRLIGVLGNEMPQNLAQELTKNSSKSSIINLQGDKKVADDSLAATQPAAAGYNPAGQISITV